MSGEWRFGTILERRGLTVMFVKRVGARPRFIGLDLNGPQQGRMMNYSTIGIDGRPDWKAVDDPDITITARSDAARHFPAWERIARTPAKGKVHEWPRE